MIYAARAGFKGMRGFDCNQVLSDKHLRAALLDGYSFVLRYLPRHTQRDYDVTPEEIRRITSHGFGFAPVQHVELPNWVPTVQKATAYGFVAGGLAKQYGLAAGSNVFLDLEGVDRSVSSDEVIKYCKTWYMQVKLMGFRPGLYVGYDPGLSASELYWKLPFDCYWAAYNLNNDQRPAVRGTCMQQHKQQLIKGTNVMVDPNTITGDSLGGYPTFTYQDEVYLSVGG